MAPCWTAYRRRRDKPVEHKFLFSSLSEIRGSLLLNPAKQAWGPWVIRLSCVGCSLGLEGLTLFFSVAMTTPRTPVWLPTVRFVATTGWANTGPSTDQRPMRPKRFGSLTTDGVRKGSLGLIPVGPPGKMIPLTRWVGQISARDMTMVRWGQRYTDFKHVNTYLMLLYKTVPAKIDSS